MGYCAARRRTSFATGISSTLAFFRALNECESSVDRARHHLIDVRRVQRARDVRTELRGEPREREARERNRDRLERLENFVAKRAPWQIDKCVTCGMGRRRGKRHRRHAKNAHAHEDIPLDLP